MTSDALTWRFLRLLFLFLERVPLIKRNTSESAAPSRLGPCQFQLKMRVGLPPKPVAFFFLFAASGTSKELETPFSTLQSHWSKKKLTD